MANLNTLSGLIPVIYEALDTVAREQIGFIPAVSKDAEAEMVAVGQTIRSPVAPASTASDITPGAYAPDSGGQVIGYKDITITKSRAVPVQWTGEEIKSVNDKYASILSDQFKQAFRALANEVEVDLALAAKKGASRAFGTAGTTPFATAADLTDFANALRILEDNGSPSSDLHFVINNAAMVNLRGKHSELFRVNEAGTSNLLRNGVIGQLMNFDIHNSKGITLHTKGTGTGYLVNNAGPYPIGTSSIAVDTGTGTVLAGDVVTFAGDTNKYVVGADLSSTPVVLNAPGLVQTLADNVAMTVGNNYTGNFAFHKSALQLVARTPAMPTGGDAAVDVMTVVDPISGLPFQIAMYKQYRQVHFEVSLAWGVGIVKSEFIATLLG